MSSPTLLVQVEQWKASALVYAPGARLAIADIWASFVGWNTALHNRCLWGRKEFGHALKPCGFEVGRGSGGVRIVRNYEIKSVAEPI